MSSPRATGVPKTSLTVAVVGATAAGKTGLSLDLAERLHGEIVNTDAMQVYRGMDIGTAKLPEAERRGIRHHLLDLLEISEPATVAQFQALARDTIAGLHAEGRTPVLVGGSALYTRAVLDRFDFPGSDAEVRRRLEQEWDAGEPLLERLRELDPVSAERIHAMTPGNGRRIIRALEVIELTGKPFSARLPVQEYVDPHTLQIGVDIDRDTLDTRIRARVKEMFDQGFVQEVESLLSRGLREAPTASTAIGYREVVAHLDGVLTLEEAIERTAVRTRQFSRRQDQWFRKDPRIVWVRYDDPARVEKALAAANRMSP